MKRINQIFIVCLLIVTATINAQVKIGNNVTTLQDGSLLELETNGTKAGLKLAEVALTDVNDVTTIPVTAASKGMVVYNSAASGIGSTGVVPGVYTYDGTKWVKFDTKNEAGSGLDLGYVVAWPANTIPPDFLLPLNGGTYNWADFTDLQTMHSLYPNQFISTSNATTFTLIDINTNGRFLRGGSTAGVTQAAATALPSSAFTISSVSAGTPTGSISSVSAGTPSGSLSTDGAHQHPIGLRGNDGGWAGANPTAFHNGMSAGGGTVSTTDRPITGTATTSIIQSSGSHSHTFTGTALAAHNHTFAGTALGAHNHTLAGGDSETRPINISVMWCLKAKSLSTSGSVTVNNLGSITATNGLTAVSGSTNVSFGGTLVNNTTIEMATKTLNFNNGYIGIGSATPSFKLHISGDATTAWQNAAMILNNTGTNGRSYSFSSRATGPNIGLNIADETSGVVRMSINSSGFVGIDTVTPTQKLDVVGNVKFSGSLMPNNTAGTTGQVLTSAGSGAAPTWQTPAAVSFGDVKTGLQTADHSGWIKLDGRLISTLTTTQQTQATALGIGTNLPNATGSVLMQNGTTLGSVSGSMNKTIAQNQLPNVTLSGTTSSNGDHNHSYVRTSNVGEIVAGGSGAVVVGQENSNVGATTGNAGTHTHTLTTSSINGGVTQQTLDVTPQSLSVNTFIYLGN
ncbi:hypothetical protein [Flavobacterium sp.]|uniref:hypothetical protein n=1 Tax=Flavobacterium sp. TaxID=239 RepID=UPI0026031DE7|nr:hypothetical protein [Flavobacterium sp.]